MSFLSTTWVAKALGVSPPSAERQISQITSDSREARPGCLFVALESENIDGHTFVERALAAGATALIHRIDFTPPKDVVSFPVPHTLAAWRRLARAWRQEFHLPLAAVAGSAGKTTTKEFLAALFRGKWKQVLVTQASQNGFQGVPSTLLRLNDQHEAAVIEVGIDEPGAMVQHLELVEPDAGLLTSIGPEHLEKLIDLDTVEKEEGLLFQVLERTQGLAAVNMDDARIARQASVLKNALVVTYGLKAPAKIRGRIEGKTLWVEGLEKKGGFPLPLEGAHNASNLLGALTLAHGLGLTVEEMQAGLSTFTPPPGRSELHQWRGCQVLADTYNSNPASVEAALETLSALEGTGVSWVCLGDMLEMGKLEESLHRGLAGPILKAGCRHVLLYGPRMKKLEEELRAKSYSGTLEHFSSHEALAARIRAEACPGDKILLKGSRGMRMENVWKDLQG